MGDSTFGYISDAWVTCTAYLPPFQVLDTVASATWILLDFYILLLGGLDYCCLDFACSLWISSGGLVLDFYLPGCSLDLPGSLGPGVSGSLSGSYIVSLGAPALHRFSLVFRFLFLCWVCTAVTACLGPGFSAFRFSACAPLCNFVLSCRHRFLGHVPGRRPPASLPACLHGWRSFVPCVSAFFYSRFLHRFLEMHCLGLHLLLGLLTVLRSRFLGHCCACVFLLTVSGFVRFWVTVSFLLGGSHCLPGCSLDFVFTGSPGSFLVFSTLISWISSWSFLGLDLCCTGYLRFFHLLPFYVSAFRSCTGFCHLLPFLHRFLRFHLDHLGLGHCTAVSCLPAACCLLPGSCTCL